MCMYSTQYQRPHSIVLPMYNTLHTLIYSGTPHVFSSPRSRFPGAPGPPAGSGVWLHVQRHGLPSLATQTHGDMVRQPCMQDTLYTHNTLTEPEVVLLPLSEGSIVLYCPFKGSFIRRVSQVPLYSIMCSLSLGIIVDIAVQCTHCYSSVPFLQHHLNTSQGALSTVSAGIAKVLKLSTEAWQVTAKLLIC